MAKKPEKRTDEIAKAEEATGIHYSEIIKSACKGTGRSYNQNYEMVYRYEIGKRIPQKVYDFAVFLSQEWKRKEATKNDSK